MKCRWIAEFLALAPDWVVVIVTVDAQHIQPIRITAADPLPFHHWNRAPNQTAQRDCFDTERFTVFKFSDGLLWRVHGNHADGCDTIGKFRPRLGSVLIKGATTS